MKRYYTVLVASAQYHGTEALTYSSDGEILIGAIVLVPMQRAAILGVVTGTSGKPRFATKDILEVFDVPPLPAALIRLTEWMQEYYPAPLGMIAQQIVPNVLSPKTVGETPGLTAGAVAASATLQPDDLPPLTTEQAASVARMQEPNTYLLHGDTGTGKTRVYIELALKAVASGRSAIVLTPEIGLTSQLAASFRRVFGDRVIIVHSQLTPKARQQTWLQICKTAGGGVPLIVLGPRSALFSPLPDIGLIVVDESHEPAYKQEQAPHYHAVRVASQLAHAHGASLVLGSATPPINDYYIAERLHKPIIRMTQIATSEGGTWRVSPPEGRSTSDRDASGSGSASLKDKGASNPPGGDTSPVPSSLVTTTVVDLKNRDEFGRSQYISKAMLKAIDLSLQRGEQSLLYLNRRGTARVILCNTCGWQAVCPHCDLPLTYHHDLHILQCHTCGYKQATPTSCPECGNADVVFKVVGTKAIEEEVKRLYPNARVMRFDTDNKKAERFEQHYEAVKAGDIDILIGTQLLAKGLDLPRLSTLGVVIADTSLTFPDYSAEERTYQLLAQVIGRVGRGHLDAAGRPIEQRIIVQSYAPDRPVITAALTRCWDTFYQNELAEREMFFFPPFCYLLKLTCRRATSKSAEKAAEQFLYTIEELKLPLLIEGPMPSFHAKVGDKFEWQLILKSKQRPALLRVIALLKTDAKSGWSYDIDPVNLL
ncbi:MAG TPA: primosomal protein N' [Candidatus Saccharimonadales bacterium]